MNYKYELIIYWSEKDQCFVVLIPELPGCMTDGLTYEDALQNAHEAIHAWIEGAKENGLEIPKPVGKMVAVP